MAYMDAGADANNPNRKVRIEELKVLQFREIDEDPSWLDVLQFRMEEIKQLRQPVSLRKRKRWIVEDESQDKKRKMSSKDDLLDLFSAMMMFNYLDVQSLVQCLTLSKAWNLMIRSSASLCWSPKRKEQWILITTHLERVKWTPDGYNSFFPLVRVNDIFDHYKVVAADGGLVCIQRTNLPFDYVWSVVLAVGNPVTQQWRLLPQGREGMQSTYVTMVVLDNGEFRVGTSDVSDWDHEVTVFDSVTNDWSSTRLHFPPKAAFKFSYFDLRMMRWVTDIIRSDRITTGLENPDIGEAVHILGHPMHNEFSVWEYNGQQYFASAWYRQNDDCRIAGAGIWKIDKTKRLELVNAIRFDHLEDVKELSETHLSDTSYMSCRSVENLVCFAGNIGFVPVIIYDLSTGCWSTYAPDEFLEKGDSKGGVVFSPSFIDPSLKL